MIGLDDRDPNAPWVPENARPFVVGDRVRVRLSGECRFHRNGGRGVRSYPGHFPWEDGATGFIDVVGRGLNSLREGHTVVVRFDPEISYVWPDGTRDKASRATYAAIELNHLDEEAAR